MIPESHLVIGGIICSVIAIFGTILNTIALVVLCSEKKLRRNPTTILIIFLSFSNLVSSVLALPLEALSLFAPIFFKENPLLCQSSAILFYGNYGVIIFMEATLAINRWAAVCTKTYRFTRETSLAAGGLVWALALILTCLVANITTIGWDENTGTCSLVGSMKRTVLMVVTVGMPYLIICLSYSAILFTLRWKFQFSQT